MPIKFELEEQKIKRLIDNTATAIIYTSEAYANFTAYSFEDYPDDTSHDLIRNPLKFHRVSFQFFLTIQFLKLLENYDTDDKGDSSLRKLNNLLNKKYPEFNVKFKQNSQLLKEIKKSKIYEHLINLRNSSYAHSDNHVINTPLKFKFFTHEQSDEFKTILLKAELIFKNCYMIYAIDIDFRNIYGSGTPRNFLKGYFRNKKYFAENWKKKS